MYVNTLLLLHQIVISGHATFRISISKHRYDYTFVTCASAGCIIGFDLKQAITAELFQFNRALPSQSSKSPSNCVIAFDVLFIEYVLMLLHIFTSVVKFSNCS